MTKSNNDNYRTVKGLTYVCEVPQSFGKVTGFEKKNGRLLAKTESGQKMIIPTFKDKP